VQIECKSKSAQPVLLRRADLRLDLILDSDTLGKCDASKVIHGINALVFDNSHVLQAHLDGRSYSTMPSYVSITDLTTLWLLITIDGPGSSNPSSRFQLLNVYRSFRLRIRRKLLWPRYLDIPIRHIPIIAGNDKTRIVDDLG